MRTTGEKRGARGGGGAGRGSRNRDGMSVVSKTRGNRDGTRKRGGARDVDGIRSQKKNRADGVSRKKNLDEVAVESDADIPARIGRGGGRKNGLTVDGAGARNSGKNRKKSDGELPEKTKIKLPRGESMASAIVKSGITLVPVGSAESDNNAKRKAGKRGN